MATGRGKGKPEPAKPTPPTLLPAVPGKIPVELSGTLTIRYESADPAAGAARDAEIRRLTEEIMDLTTAVDNLKTVVANIQEDVSEWGGIVGTGAGELQAIIDQLRADNTAKDEQIAALQTTVDSLNALGTEIQGEVEKLAQADTELDEMATAPPSEA